MNEAEYKPLFQKRHAAETDGWVKDEIREFEEDLGGPSGVTSKWGHPPAE